MQTISSGRTVQPLAVIPVNEALLLLLEKLFPVREVRPNMAINDIMYEAGRQSVVSLLRQHYAKQSG